MAHDVVWLDHSHATIFRFTPGQVEKLSLKNEHHAHHHTGHHEQEKKNSFQKFYGDLTQKLTQSERILLVGPGLAKKEFQNYLNEHQKQLSQAVVGLEPMDKATDAQILELARKFYHQYNLFH